MSQPDSGPFEYDQNRQLQVEVYRDRSKFFDLGSFESARLRDTFGEK